MQKFYFLRSRKTGRYFEFHEYAEDGWGKYEDTVCSTQELDTDDMPKFFEQRHVDNFEKQPHMLEMQLKDHAIHEVEWVEVNVSIDFYVGRPIV